MDVISSQREREREEMGTASPTEWKDTRRHGSTILVRKREEKSRVVLFIPYLC